MIVARARDRTNTNHEHDTSAHEAYGVVHMELADIGKTFRRLDYETKVTGKAQYLADMQVPGMCHAKDSAQPAAARAHQVYRHFQGAQSSGRRGGDYAR